jgi:hypothetical protein
MGLGVLREFCCARIALCMRIGARRRAAKRKGSIGRRHKSHILHVSAPSEQAFARSELHWLGLIAWTGRLLYPLLLSAAWTT